MIALAFAGQGGQHAGMGAALFAKFPALVREADAILGYSIAELCSAGGARLADTRYTQPAVYVVDALAWREFQERTGLVPDYLLGHSVGEFAALHAAGMVDFATGLDIVRARAELMADCCGDSGMAALIGPRDALVEAIGAAPDVYLANDNAPAQVVAAGTHAGLRVLEAQVRRDDRVTFVPLPVSGAFHTPLMANAQDAFAQCLASARLEEPRIPVIANVTAAPHRRDDVRQLLVDHLVRPVRWLDSVRYLLAQGPTLLQDLGPGSAIGSLLRQIVEDAPLAAETAGRKEP